MPVRSLIAAIVLTLCTGAPAPAQDGNANDQRRRMLEAFERGDFDRAESLAREVIAADPGDARTRYNLAVILARRGDVDGSTEAIIDAISFGFVDLHEMERDPNLAEVRRSEKYAKIVARWGVLLDAVGSTMFDDLARRLGKEYHSSKDDDLRLMWLSSVDEQSTADAQREAARVAAWCDALQLFPHADPARPDPWVTLVIPTQQDFPTLVPYAMVGGTYSRDQKRLVTRDTGPTLRHEFFHVLHWRHMDRAGQVHPIWVQEGMASLLEDVELDESGAYVIRPSWRTNIAKRMEQSGLLRPLDEFVTITRDRFVASRAGGNYAQARALTMYLAEHHALAPFYRALVAGFDADQTGAAALEIALGSPIDQIDKDFRSWLAALPQVAERAHPPDAVFGVSIAPGAGDGPVVAPSNNPLARHPLMPGDVITAIDGRAVVTLDDLWRILGDFEPGDEVGVTVERAGARRELTVRLESREHPGDW